MDARGPDTPVPEDGCDGYDGCDGVMDHGQGVMDGRSGRTGGASERVTTGGFVGTQSEDSTTAYSIVS